MELTGIPAVDRWTFAGLVAFAVLALLRGWIVPKSTVDRLEARYAKENDNLNKIVEKSEEHRELLGGQLAEALQIISAHKGLMERILAIVQKGADQ